jgi:very-short-patch-repair endonuclease
MEKNLKEIKKKKYKDLSDVFISLWGDRIPVPVREYHFHPIRRWRFDIAWPDVKLAVELHGAVFAMGRHSRGAGMGKDCEKSNSAQMLGWNILTYTNVDLREKPEQIIDEVAAFLACKQK